MILAQSAATSRAYATKYEDSFDENVDLVGLGLANVGAGISRHVRGQRQPDQDRRWSTAPAAGASSRSSPPAAIVVDRAAVPDRAAVVHARTRCSPSVVFLIGIRAHRHRGHAEIYRLRPGEFAVAAVTAATVVVVGVEQGIILAIVLSILDHVYHSYRPFDRLLTLSSTGRVQYAPAGRLAQAAPGSGHLPASGRPLLRERDAVHRGDPGHHRRGSARAESGSAWRRRSSATSTTPARTRSGPSSMRWTSAGSRSSWPGSMPISGTCSIATDLPAGSARSTSSTTSTRSSRRSRRPSAASPGPDRPTDRAAGQLTEGP